MRREATITPDGLYRLDLIRAVQPEVCSCDRCLPFAVTQKAGYVLWILANPSTASASEDDPTERRGWGFTSGWGYGGMVFVNINPYRSTDPKLVRPIPVSVLALNSYYVRVHAERAAIIVCAWGTSADQIQARLTADELQHHFRDKVHTLGLTASGAPKHPLYLPKDTPLTPWRRSQYMQS